MEFDRFEVSSALDFISAVIPKDAKTGKNCMFVRVEDDKLILTGGGQFSTKKAVLVAQNTTSEKGKLPERFMIPKAELLAFQAMMKEHKADCKRLAKNDPGYLLVTITGDELISHDGKITFEQPKYQFKDLEPLFEFKKGDQSGLPIMSRELTAVIAGFKGSEKTEVSFSENGKLTHFQQGDFEAVLVTPVEKEKTKDKQTTIDEK